MGKYTTRTPAQFVPMTSPFLLIGEGDAIWSSYHWQDIDHEIRNKYKILHICYDNTSTRAIEQKIYYFH